MRFPNWSGKHGQGCVVVENECPVIQCVCVEILLRVDAIRRDLHLS